MTNHLPLPGDAQPQADGAAALPEAPRQALATHLPVDFRNLRAQRYRGEDFDMSLAALTAADQAHVRVVYQLAKGLHHQWVGMRDDPDWDALRPWVAQVLHAPFADAAKAMGRDSMAHCRDEETRRQLGKVLHDLRGGALTPLQLYAHLAEEDADPLHLRSAAFLARDHAKIMRNILPDLDPEVRRADEAERPHFMQAVVEKWDGFQFERGALPPGRISVACGYDGLLASCCLEASAVDRIVYNFINNAMRFTTGACIHLDIAPVGEHAVRWVVANPIASDQRDWLRQNTGGDLANLFRGGLTRGGTGLGLSNCADFVAAAFGLPDIDIALAGKYLGAAVAEDWYLAWAHWPSLYADTHPAAGPARH